VKFPSPLRWFEGRGYCSSKDEKKKKLLIKEMLSLDVNRLDMTLLDIDRMGPEYTIYMELFIGNSHPVMILVLEEVITVYKNEYLQTLTVKFI